MSPLRSSPRSHPVRVSYSSDSTSALTLVSAELPPIVRPEPHAGRNLSLPLPTSVPGSNPGSAQPSPHLSPDSHTSEGHGAAQHAAEHPGEAAVPELRLPLSPDGTQRPLLPCQTELICIEQVRSTRPRNPRRRPRATHAPRCSWSPPTPTVRVGTWRSRRRWQAIGWMMRRRRTRCTSRSSRVASFPLYVLLLVCAFRPDRLLLQNVQAELMHALHKRTPLSPRNSPRVASSPSKVSPRTEGDAEPEQPAATAPEPDPQS